MARRTEAQRSFRLWAGNAIQFARTCSHVIAIDIDASRLRLARHNAAKNRRVQAEAFRTELSLRERSSLLLRHSHSACVSGRLVFIFGGYILLLNLT